MISLAAVIIALSAYAVAEGINALYMEPADGYTIFGSLFGIGIGSGMIVVGSFWWVWGNPPMVIPAEMADWLRCRWEFGARYCQEMLGPLW